VKKILVFTFTISFILSSINSEAKLRPRTIEEKIIESDAIALVYMVRGNNRNEIFHDKERFFKIGAYGSKKYIEEMMKKGLKPKW